MTSTTVVSDASIFSAVSNIPSLITEYDRGDTLFTQGSPANYLYLLREGSCKLVVFSAEGESSTVHVVRPAEFLGEDCLAEDAALRATSAVAESKCAALRFRKRDVLQALEDNQPFIAAFTSFLLGKGARAQAAVTAQFFSSSEQRLARLLLLMAEDGLRTGPSAILPPITQEALAQQVGTTRSRISFFMNRFRRLGFISYDARICVFETLISVTSQDFTQTE